MKLTRSELIVVYFGVLCFALYAACMLLSFGPRTIQVAYGSIIEKTGAISFFSLAAASILLSIMVVRRTNRSRPK